MVTGRIAISGSGGIKSIQRGIATITSGSTTFNQPITSIDTTKSIVIITESSPNTSRKVASATITSATNVQFQLLTTDVNNHTIAYEVIEYYSVKSLQRGSTVVGSGATVNQAITTVDLNKAILIISIRQDGYVGVRARLSSATNIEFLTSFVAGATVQWEVLELF